MRRFQILFRLATAGQRQTFFSKLFGASSSEPALLRGKKDSRSAQTNSVMSVAHFRPCAYASYLQYVEKNRSMVTGKKVEQVSQVLWLQ